MLTVLHRIDPDKNMDRWNPVAIQATLFDSVVYVCQQGSRHPTWKQTCVVPVADEARREQMVAATLDYDVIS